MVQASVLVPSIFIEHDPQMPSPQERRKVSVGSMAFLIQISASSTIGPQLSQSGRPGARLWRSRSRRCRSEVSPRRLTRAKRPDPEGLAAVLRPLPRIGAQTGVAEHEPVSDPVADAQAQEAGGP